MAYFGSKRRANILILNPLAAGADPQNLYRSRTRICDPGEVFAAGRLTNALKLTAGEEGLEPPTPGFGRRRKLTTHQRGEALARRKKGDETLVEIARSYNVSHSTISRL
jgi:hypothetical protein